MNCSLESILYFLLLFFSPATGIYMTVNNLSPIWGMQYI